jgi:hypothetical protein
VQSIRADETRGAAIDAIADLLTRLRLDFAFVAGAARSAWLGSIFDRGPVDVLALMKPEQKDQVAMMANNRGFDVSRQEIESTDEMDVIPLRFKGTRVHVLVASNALYGRMIASATPATVNDREVRVANAEDMAVLAIVGDDDETADALVSLPSFDHERLRKKLMSIGLGGAVTGE